jgi:rhodanese-related sulfurtransferase
MIRTFIIAFTLFVSATLAFAQSKIDAPTALELAKKGEILLVDIRRPSEWAETGVATVARPITMHSEGFVEKLEALIKANPGKKVALICAGGVRSHRMQGILAGQGMSNIIDVSEGMMGNASNPGWVARGLPVRKP